MKRVYSFIVLMLPIYVQAVSIEVDGSAFFPTHNITREIYGAVWPDVAITVDHLQPFDAIEQLSFFVAADFLFKHGRSLCFKQETYIRLIPLTFGLKWIQTINDRVEVYAGLAPKYYWMHIKNESAYVPCSSNQNGCGGYVTVGTFIYPTQHFMIDWFLSYSYMNFKAPCSTQNPLVIGFRTDVSGINFGVGFGWNF